MLECIEEQTESNNAKDETANNLEKRVILMVKFAKQWPEFPE